MELITISTSNTDLIDKLLVKYSSQHTSSSAADEISNKSLYTFVGVNENEPISLGYIFRKDDAYYIDFIVLDEYRSDIYVKFLINTLQKEVIDKYNVSEIYFTTTRENEYYLNQAVSQGKFELEKIEENSVLLKFIVGNEVSVSTSLGDAFDSLSKLEITVSDLKELKYVKMYNELFSKLEHFMDGNTEYHYNILKEINYKISALMNKKDKSLEEYNYLEMLRYRVIGVKNKIDTILCSKKHSISLLKKSKDKLFLSSNLSLSDIINNNGMVRYLTTVYDQVYYPVNQEYLELVTILYKDEPNLKLVSVKDFDELFTMVLDQSKIKEITDSTETTILTCSRYPTFTDLREPEFVHASTIKAYTNIKVDSENFWSCFHIPDTPLTVNLYKILLQYGINSYVFIHNHTTTKKYFETSLVEREIGKSKDDILYINPRHNEYSSDHPFYTIAEAFVNRPIIDYKQVLIHATYVYLTNSSFLSMAIHLPLETYNFYYVGIQDLSFVYDENSKYKFYESEFRKFIHLQQ